MRSVGRFYGEESDMFNWKSILKNVDLVQTGLLIDGDWLESSEKTWEVRNPFDNEVIARVAWATDKDVRLAIDTSYHAFLTWGESDAGYRSKLLRRWYDLIINNMEDLAKIITLECGKAIREARSEVIYAASFIKWYSEEAMRVSGRTIPTSNKAQRAMVINQPIGVCALITPWNFPSAMLARKVAPALATGCTAVVRPSERTPLSSLALGYLALEAGIPRGVINVICGDGAELGKIFANSEIIKKLSFTGSTKVGRSIYEASAVTIKKLSLELGGNAPFIVFKDADIDKALEDLMKTKFRNAGQTCVSVNRVFLDDLIYEKFVQKLAHKIEALVVGDGLLESTDIGPLININAVKHAKDLVKDAINLGAKLVVGDGSRQTHDTNFFEPVLLTECTCAMRIFNEEIFAPIIAVYRFKSVDEAIALANQTPYGLAGYFYANDLKLVYKVMEQLEYGMVGVNTSILSGETTPFGGIKFSGFGREGGKEGIAEYLNKKFICIDLS